MTRPGRTLACQPACLSRLVLQQSVNWNGVVALLLIGSYSYMAARSRSRVEMGKQDGESQMDHHFGTSLPFRLW